MAVVTNRETSQLHTTSKS